MRPATLTTVSCTFLVLNLLAFMAVAAVLPSLIAEWEMSNARAGWLGGIFFAGYMVAVPVLVPLTDRIPPRRICLSASILGAAVADPRFVCRTSDVASAANGDTLVASGTTYTIRSAENDGTGVTTLVLEA